MCRNKLNKSRKQEGVSNLEEQVLYDNMMDKKTMKQWQGKERITETILRKEKKSKEKRRKEKKYKKKK